MKKTAFVLTAAAAVAAAGISLTQAQTSVTSANAVGYVKVDVVGNKYNMVGLPFVGINSTNAYTMAELLGTNVPDGTQVFIFNPVTKVYDTETFYGSPDNVWDPNVAKIPQGGGFWVFPPSSFSVYLLGQVPTNAPTIQLRGPTSYAMMTYPYPVEKDVNTFGWTPTDGDQIFMFNVAAGIYDTYTYYGAPDNIWDPALVVKPGQAFWYNSNTSNSWTAVKPWSGFP